MKQYQNKREVIEDFLAHGLIMVHVDSRRRCDVPPEHAGKPALRINLSKRFEGANIVITDAGVEATLTFGGVPYRIYLPWECIYAVTSKTMNPPACVFAADVPEEVTTRIRDQALQGVDAYSVRAELKKLYAELPTEELECHRVAIAEVLIDRANPPEGVKTPPSQALQDLVGNLMSGSYDPTPDTTPPGTRRFTVIKGGKPD